MAGHAVIIGDLPHREFLRHLPKHIEVFILLKIVERAGRRGKGRPPFFPAGGFGNNPVHRLALLHGDLHSQHAAGTELTHQHGQQRPVLRDPLQARVGKYNIKAAAQCVQALRCLAHTKFKFRMCGTGRATMFSELSTPSTRAPG